MEQTTSGWIVFSRLSRSLIKVVRNFLIAKITNRYSLNNPNLFSEKNNYSEKILKVLCLLQWLAIITQIIIWFAEKKYFLSSSFKNVRWFLFFFLYIKKMLKNIFDSKFTRNFWFIKKKKKLFSNFIYLFENWAYNERFSTIYRHFLTHFKNCTPSSSTGTPDNNFPYLWDLSY